MTADEMRFQALKRLSVHFLTNPFDKTVYILLQGLLRNVPEEQKVALKRQLMEGVKPIQNKKEWRKL